MKWPAILAGIVMAVALGWGAGRYWPQGEPPPEPPPPVDREAADAMVLPEKLDTPEARAWAVGLEFPVLRGLIERLSTDHDSAEEGDALDLLLGVFFERDGAAAADEWLKIEADCQPDVDGNLARWAGREPEAASAWLSSHIEELYRFRNGALPVEASRRMMEGCAYEDPTLAVGWLMEKPEFFDDYTLHLLARILHEAGDRERLLIVANWVREKSADPRHALATVSGGPLDPGGRAVGYLADLDPATALGILAQVPAGDPRRKPWVEQLKHLPGAPAE